VLLVTHDSRILDIADRILTLEDGHIDEANLRIERLVREAVSLVTLLADYPRAFVEPSKIDSLAQQFQGRAQDLLETLATIAGQHGGAVSERALRWMTITEHLRNLKDCLGNFAAIIRRSPPAALEFTEMIKDSLDFLLQTTANTVATTPSDGLELLLQLTTDNGPAVHSIRDQYVDFQDALAPEAGGLVFELASMFLRTTYFLHEIAKGLKADKGT